MEIRFVGGELAKGIPVVTGFSDDVQFIVVGRPVVEVGVAVEAGLVMVA